MKRWSGEFNWSEAAVVELRALWAAGFTASGCVEALARKFPPGRPSRNAVCGKINRLGLSTPHVKMKTQERRKRNAVAPVPRVRKTPALRKTGYNTFAFQDQIELVETISSLSPDEIPLAQRKQLFDLQPNDCRWPCGDVGQPDFFFCGGVISGSGSYCAYHHRISVGAWKYEIADLHRARRREARASCPSNLSNNNPAPINGTATRKRRFTPAIARTETNIPNGNASSAACGRSPCIRRKDSHGGSGGCLMVNSGKGSADLRRCVTTG